MNEIPTPPWQATLRDEIRETVVRRRLGPALMAVGWLHLGLFAACQAIVDPAVVSDPRHAGLWVIDLLGSLGILRLISGAGWYRDTPAAVLVARIWGTFLILAFSLATLNVLSGWSHDWFKPPWATISSFSFAMMAWMFDLRFLLLAVQMYVTGLLMITFPKSCYVIFGVSWWLALQLLGFVLWRMASRAAAQGISRSWKSNGTSVATPATPK
jgi:hypothetical protein